MQLRPPQTICAKVAYDGTDFCGFQFQKTGISVQQRLEEALSNCIGTFQRIAGSGRTDAGVHAAGQIIMAQVSWRHSLDTLQRAWNHHLPDTILIRDIAPAPEGFHPRFSATSRQYRYQVLCPKEGKPSYRRYPLVERDALLVSDVLDVERMNEAASLLVGEHNFATFGQPPQGEITIRVIHSIGWATVKCAMLDEDDFPFQRLVFHVEANAFLRRMVRNLVGSLIAVGKSKWNKADLQAALQAQERQRSAPPAPPQGLTLERVFYQKYPNLFG